MKYPPPPSPGGSRKQRGDAESRTRGGKSRTEKPNHVVFLDHLRPPPPLLHGLQILPIAGQGALGLDARVGGHVGRMVEDAGGVADLFAEEVRGRFGR